MKYFITSILILYGLALSGQYDQATAIDTYQSARQSIFLLKNEYAKIPIINADVSTVKHFYLGDLAGFCEDMNLYFPIEKTSLTIQNIQQGNQTTLKIISLDLSAISLNDKNIKTLEKILAEENTITIIFGNENQYRQSAINFSRCSHLLYAKGRDKLQQSLAVQILFGGISADHTLDVDLSESFKKGAGYISKGNIRLAYAPPATVNMDAQVLNKGISAIAQTAIDSGAFPGCQVLVVKDQKVIFHEAWGHHTYAQKQIVQKSDIYDFASLTKITSALPALMKLQGEGKLKLDDPLKVYFPKFEKTNKADLSIRSILAHQAKLKPWIPYWRTTIKKNGKYKWRTFKKRQSRRFPIKITDQLYLHRNYKKKIYRAIKKSPLNDQSAYVYSGLAFYLWPEIVSDLVNEDFETYLKKTFYQPLGASTITYNPDQHFSLDRIIPTENDTFFRKVQIHGKVHDEGAIMMGGVSANAGLFGNANDLAKLMQLYLNEGTYGGQRFIDSTAVREFTRCQYCESGNRRGLGFDKPLIEYHPQKSSVAKAASPASYGHSGYTGTFVWVDPAQQLIYIFFSNRVYPTRENRKIYQLNIRPRIHEVIYEALLDME